MRQHLADHPDLRPARLFHQRRHCGRGIVAEDLLLAPLQRIVIVGGQSEPPLANTFHHVVKLEVLPSIQVQQIPLGPGRYPSAFQPVQNDRPDVGAEDRQPVAEPLGHREHVHVELLLRPRFGDHLGKQREIGGDRARLQQEQLPGLKGPFDVDRETVMVLGRLDEGGQFEDLRRAQGLRARIGRRRFGDATVRGQVQRDRLLRDPFFEDLHRHLVDDVMIGCDDTRHDRLAQPEAGVDHRLVVAIVHRVQRKAYAADLAGDLALHDHADRGAFQRDALLRFVAHHPNVEHRGIGPRDNACQLLARGAEKGLVHARETGPCQILFGRRRPHGKDGIIAERLQMPLQGGALVLRQCHLRRQGLDPVAGCLGRVGQQRGPFRRRLDRLGPGREEIHGQRKTARHRQPGPGGRDQAQCLAADLGQGGPVGGIERVDQSSSCGTCLACVIGGGSRPGRRPRYRPGLHPPAPGPDQRPAIRPALSERRGAARPVSPPGRADPAGHGHP